MGRRWIVPTAIATLGVALVLALLGCDLLPPAQRDDPPFAIEVHAGPVCTAEQLQVPGPADPRCDPRPVAGARMVITAPDAGGLVVAEGLTDLDGRLELELGPGNYVLIAGEVAGLTGPSAPIAFSLRANEERELLIPYDTGIR